MYPHVCLLTQVPESALCSEGQEVMNFGFKIVPTSVYFHKHVKGKGRNSQFHCINTTSQSDALARAVNTHLRSTPASSGGIIF